MLKSLRKLLSSAKWTFLKARGCLPFFRRFHCPICGVWSRRFRPFGVIPRPNAQCPSCGALERHRLVWLFFQRQMNLFSPGRKKFLHFAPEPVFTAFFSRIPNLDYITADLNKPAMEKVDITCMPFPNETFDIIFCSHVLEHVPNDRKAMEECYRVLRKNGVAVLMVPIRASSTEEDLTITDPKERERLYGQFDHVRNYGLDFADRLRHAGFEVTIYSPKEVAGEKIAHFAIPPEEGPVFFCQKN